VKRITGTSVYTYPKCARAVALDFHGDPKKKRKPTEVEEFVLRRGRDLEDELTEGLGWETPSFPERDFDAGAAATLELLRAGAPGVLQGVLVEDDRLGILDLVRREEGPSNFGDHHYVVGDVKSSAVGRGDQILQVMFYSRLLARLQGREPAYAYLVLRDGHEERFQCADYADVIDDVEQNVAALRSGDQSERPFLSRACGGCRWSDVCLPELSAAGDLSLLQGMTRGLRETLESAGVADVEAARSITVEPLARRTKLEATLLRRIKRAALAQEEGAPLLERRSSKPPEAERVIVHMLADAFAERVHYFGALIQGGDRDGEILEAFPASRESELPAFLELIEQVGGAMTLWHYGGALPRWYEETAWRLERSTKLEARFVDLARRLRGAAVYPGPVFGLADHVRHGLARDPNRAGDAGGVGLWAEQPEPEARLRAKGRVDLEDLAALVSGLLEGGGDAADA